MGLDSVASAIDLFCGAGGLSCGLQAAGIDVVAGVDLDPACQFPFEHNIGAKFLERDVKTVTGDELRSLWLPGRARILAGCAPCQPFSPYRRGDSSTDEKWPLLRDFGRLITEARPEIVTMENVPRLGTTTVFDEFLSVLVNEGYCVSWQSCRCVDYGLPQHRRRLVLLASFLGAIEVPDGQSGDQHVTVGDTIRNLRPIAAGEVDPKDPLHRSRGLSPKNIERIRASSPGGTWEDWPEALRSPCHVKKSGASFRNVYSRMEWTEPAPTITTSFDNFGTGRFGHPDQDRTLSIREAAMLQGFPPDYSFVASGETPTFKHLGRLIGNAVPPPIGQAVGEAIVAHLSTGVLAEAV